MPPNTVTISNRSNSEPVNGDYRFADHFWSCDRSGMDQLFNYFNKAHDTLNEIHELYKARAEMEHEIGEKMIQLAETQQRQQREDATIVTAANQGLDAMYQELAHTGESHLELANRLTRMADDFSAWTSEQRDALNQLSRRIEKMYKSRQDKLTQVINFRCSMSDAEEAVNAWNQHWIQACQELEAMEEDRLTFVMTSVWEYANLCSAKLLVQDEWSEAIRKRLEECSVQQDIRAITEQCGTGTTVTAPPSASDYVAFMSAQLRDIATKKLPPRPQATSPVNGTFSSTVKRKPLDKGNLEELLKRLETVDRSMASSKREANNNNTSGSSGGGGGAGGNAIGSTKMQERSPRMTATISTTATTTTTSTTATTADPPRSPRIAPNSAAVVNPNNTPTTPTTTSAAAVVEPQAPLMIQTGLPLPKSPRPSSIALSPVMSPYQQPQVPSPYHSPAMSPSPALSPCIPPAAAAPPPPPAAYQYTSNHLPDGRPILYWVRAKYDYLANDETEISFKRGSLFAVTGMSQDEGWWIAELWDETWHCSCGSGCIPSNYMMMV